jgi:hypothetical protein
VFAWESRYVLITTRINLSSNRSKLGGFFQGETFTINNRKMEETKLLGQPDEPDFYDNAPVTFAVRCQHQKLSNDSSNSRSPACCRTRSLGLEHLRCVLDVSVIVLLISTVAILLARDSALQDARHHNSDHKTVQQTNLPAGSDYSNFVPKGKMRLLETTLSY